MSKLEPSTWDSSKYDSNRYRGMSAVRAMNKIYSAEQIKAHKDWVKSHAEPEPGMGLDGRPLQKGGRKDD